MKIHHFCAIVQSFLIQTIKFLIFNLAIPILNIPPSSKSAKDWISRTKIMAFKVISN